MTETTRALPEVSADLRAAIEAAERTSDAHRALMQRTEAMHLLETGGAATAPLPQTFTVAAWNVERCLFPETSAAHLAGHGPQVLLLSEMDIGMARTGQRNTPAEMAAALGMAYAYGLEFFELDLGGETERHFCEDDFNAKGWHGNAILSSAPFDRLALLRLDDHGHWFIADANATDPGQPRIGGRMAVLAEIGGVCFASTHLESNAGAAHRAAQFTLLMDTIEDFAPGLPVVIGGDLNTGNHMPPDFDWRRESLFDAARARGYSWDANPPGMTTRPSLITPHPTRQMKLDWFCTRGLSHSAPQILSSLDPSGRPLSDHDPILATFARA